MTITDLLKKILKNIGILVTGTGISMALTFVTVALNARALGAEGLGIITLMQAYVALVIGLFSFGTQQPTIRLGASAIRENNSVQLGVIFTIGIIFDTIGAVLGGFVCLIFLPVFVGSSQILEAYTFGILAFCLTAFLSGGGTMNGIFRLYGRFHYISIVQILLAMLNLMGSVALWLAEAPLVHYLIMYAIAQAIAYIVHLALGFVTIRKHGASVSLIGQRLWGSEIFRSFLDYSWTTWATSTINTVRSRADTLLLAFSAGPAAVGIYGVARQLTTVLNRMTQAVSSAVFSEVSFLAAEKDARMAHNLLIKLTLGGVFAGASMVVSAVAFGRLLLGKGFGPQFSEGYGALVLLVVAASLMLSAATFGGFVQAFISARKLLEIYVLSIVPFVAACALFIEPLGMIGAALTQVAFACAVWILSWTALRGRLRPEG